jgi:MFS family permease
MFDIGRTFYDRPTRSVFFVTNVTPQTPSSLDSTAFSAAAVRPPRMLRPGPLAGRYPAVAAMVVLFLVPYLALSAALQPITPLIASSLHMSLQTTSLTTGMANAAYAAGTVLAVQFAQHLPQRRMMVVYAVLLVIGSVLAAAATDAPMFIVGHILQGLCTSLLLIAAAPPLFLGYPPAKLRWTTMLMNMCIFGAVAAGPLVGGAQASSHAWRPLFWIAAGVAVLALILGLLTFEDAPPANREAPRDSRAIGLAVAGSVAAFWGVSELTTHGFADPVALAPLLGGLVLIIVLWVYQYRGKRTLLTLRPLASTYPVAGIVVAITAAAASVSAIALTSGALATRYAPLHLGLIYLPELGGAILASIAFGVVFSTKYIHYFTLFGMASLAVGIYVIMGSVPPSEAMALAGAALIGVGVGASVVPALFLAGFSLRSASIQRVFAILELMRAIAAFMIVPILAHFAISLTGHPTPAMQTTLWVCFGLAVGGTVVGVLLYVLGGSKPPAPSLERFLVTGEAGWHSPALFAGIRRNAGNHERTGTGTGQGLG